MKQFWFIRRIAVYHPTVVIFSVQQRRTRITATTATVMVPAAPTLTLTMTGPVTSSRSSNQASRCFDMFPAVVAVVRRTSLQLRAKHRTMRDLWQVRGLVCLVVLPDLRAQWAWSRSRLRGVGVLGLGRRFVAVHCDVSSSSTQCF